MRTSSRPGTPVNGTRGWIGMPASSKEGVDSHISRPHLAPKHIADPNLNRDLEMYIQMQDLWNEAPPAGTADGGGPWALIRRAHLPIRAQRHIFRRLLESGRPHAVGAVVQRWLKAAGTSGPIQSGPTARISCPVTPTQRRGGGSELSHAALVAQAFFAAYCIGSAVPTDWRWRRKGKRCLQATMVSLAFASVAVSIPGPPFSTILVCARAVTG